MIAGPDRSEPPPQDHIRYALAVTPSRRWPELVNDDPLGAAWFFKMKLTDPSEIDGLMDEDAYKELIG